MTTFITSSITLITNTIHTTQCNSATIAGKGLVLVNHTNFKGEFLNIGAHNLLSTKY